MLHTFVMNMKSTYPKKTRKVYAYKENCKISHFTHKDRASYIGEHNKKEGNNKNNNTKKIENIKRENIIFRAFILLITNEV